MNQWLLVLFTNINLENLIFLRMHLSLIVYSHLWICIKGMVNLYLKIISFTKLASVNEGCRILCIKYIDCSWLLVWCIIYVNWHLNLAMFTCRYLNTSRTNVAQSVAILAFGAGSNAIVLFTIIYFLYLETSSLVFK